MGLARILGNIVCRCDIEGKMDHLCVTSTTCSAAVPRVAASMCVVALELGLIRV